MHLRAFPVLNPFLALAVAFALLATLSLTILLTGQLLEVWPESHWPRFLLIK